MPFVFSAPLRERLLWPFPEFFEKCPLIKEQLALPFISLNVLEFKVSTRSWSRLCPLALQKWPLVHRAEGRSTIQSQEDFGNDAHGPNIQADANHRLKSSSPKDAPWENRETLERSDFRTSIRHFAWCLLEAALCFSIGDDAGINCQTCLTPPCHLIIACNTPECWQCWAIDSWHSLKLLIIISHKPLSDLSTSLYCLWRG